MVVCRCLSMSVHAHMSKCVCVCVCVSACLIILIGACFESLVHRHAILLIFCQHSGLMFLPNLLGCWQGDIDHASSVTTVCVSSILKTVCVCPLLQIVPPTVSLHTCRRLSFGTRRLGSFEQSFDAGVVRSAEKRMIVRLQHVSHILRPLLGHVDYMIAA